MGKKSDHAANPPLALTRSERKAIWISAAVALFVLAGLFVFGMFSGFRADERFLPGFYWIANVIAACAGGILASTITGFLTVRLNTKIGKTGRLVIEGAGGFAVFLLVMWANPQNQMFKLADSIFASLLSDCALAARTGDDGLRSNAKESCARLMQAYPLRPEPYSYLAGWTHIYKRDSAGEAADLYQKALLQYGLSMSPVRAESMNSHSLTPVQLIRISQDLSSYSFAKGDYLLTAYARKEISLATVLSGLNEIVRASHLLEDDLLNVNSDPNIWARTFDVRGKIFLYRYFLEGKKNIHDLKEAIATYDIAIKKERDFPLMLQYHKFVGLVLLRANNTENSESPKEVLSQLLQSWTPHFEAQWVQIERPAYKEFFAAILSNTRREAWEVTRPFGSTEFGGKEIRSFLLKDPSLLSQLTTRVRRL